MDITFTNSKGGTIMKRVIHLLTTDKYSGAENVAIQIVNHINMRYTDVECYYVSPKGDIENILVSYSCKYSLIDKFSYFQLRKLNTRLEPDIIHAHDFIASVMATICFPGKKIISHLHNNAPWIQKKGIFSFIYYCASARITKILTVSEAIENEYVYAKKLKDKFECIGNPIDTMSILDKAKEYSIQQQFDLIFLGRLTKAKNPDLLRRVFLKAIEKKSSIKIAIVGDGEYYQEFENWIEQNCLGTNIKMYGFQENPYPILNNSKVLVLPSKWEGFGLVSIEALTLGKPVVCSNAGGLKKIVTKNCGYVIENENVDQYVSEILELVNDENYYERKHNAALDRAKDLNNIDQYIEQVYREYEIEG